jgi:PAS domain S-box-containing protein
MMLRKKVFLRTYSLLAILTLAICATMSVSLVVHHRNTQKQDGRLTAVFIAKNATTLVLWDDRIGLKFLLEEAIQSNPAIEYAFVERGHRPYVHAMQDGVPKGLLGLQEDPKGAAVVEVQNRKGDVVYDIGASVADTDAIVRLGLSRAAIDAQSSGGLLGILVVCLTMLALGLLLAAWVAARVTREVSVMTGALLLDESRMAALLQLNQMTSTSMPEITAFVLEEAVRLTESTIGYVAFLNEDESLMTMHAWPKAAMQEFAIADPTTKTGLWGEAVRQRKPIIVGDDAATNPPKKGRPEGHVKIASYMNVPIFDGDRIVVVAGVGNKKEDYNKSDVRQLTLLMQGMWQTIRRREVAEELRKARDELEIRVHERTRELQISGDRYEQLAKQSGTFNWEVDAQGVYTYVSRVSETVLGYRPDELVGRMHFYDLHPEAGREAFKAAAFEVFERKERFQNLLNAVRARDGRIRWLSTNGIPLLGADGTLRGYCGSDTDVTERKRAEQALRESECYYRELIDSAADAIFVYDVPDGNIIDCNRRACEALGYSREEMLRLSVKYIDTSFSPERDVVAWKELKPGMSATLSGFHKRKDQSVFPVEVNIVAITRAGRNMIAAVARDITDRKRVEEAMRESEEWYRTLFVEALDGICLADAKTGLIIDCNQALATLVGRDRAELIGKSHAILHPPTEVKEQFSTSFRQHLSDQAGEMLDAQVISKTGEVRDVAIKARVVDLAGRTVMHGLFRDITDRKRAEDDLRRYAADLEASNKALEEANRIAESANRAKSQFLSNMSHEIRTPMTAILGYADLMLAENVALATREHIAVIKRNGEHLLGLINGILDLSKIEAGKLQIEPKACSPVQLVAEVVSLMRTKAATKQLKLNAESVHPLPQTVLTDPLRLRQILVNLVDNAIKFTEQGEVLLAVRLSAHGGHLSLCFDVTDTGIGMNKEQVGKLFQPFSQVDSSSTRKFGGTGLGLCISKHLAEALGGNIKVRSEPGKGSTFSVTIDPGPLEGMHVVEDAGEAATAPPPTDQPADTDQIVLCGRILVAEDMMENQRLIALLLRHAGADVTTVENGRLAVDAALAAREAGEPFDVILMDMHMPVMDGYEATRQLRMRGYTAPIVALTAHAMSQDCQECLDAGCNDYLPKPFQHHTLLELAARHITAGKEDKSLLPDGR